MLVHLHVEEGPHLGRRIDLKNGQTAVIGSSDYADFCFAEDLQMAEKHFQLSIENNRCQFVHLAKEHSSDINTEEAITADLQDGDRIRAGLTCFRIRIDHQNAVDTSDEENTASFEIAQETIDLNERCVCLQLSEDAIAYCDQYETREELLETLKANQLFEDAVRLQADILGTPLAIEWAHQAINKLVGANLSSTDRIAIDSVEQWLKEPSEENRRHNESLAKERDYAGMGGAMVAAVFLSGGSIGPPDLGHDIVPEPYSAGQAVAVALMLAALDEDPDQTTKHFQTILDDAISIA
ncbi:MAG: FHA domain-containing protein [Pirellulales bacterium]|jgi:hypothetical protein